MARNDERFEIKMPFGPPRREAYSHDLITAKSWETLVSNSGVVRLDVDTAAVEPKTFAVFPAWKYGQSDENVSAWMVRSCPDEESYVADALQKMQVEVDDLTKELNGSPAPTDSRRTEILARLDELDRDMTNTVNYRYWQTVVNGMGDGCDVLYRSCSAPNVPFKLRSSFNIQPDRPFTFMFHRAKPQDGQQSSRIDFRFGHWRLRINQDSDIKLTRYKDGWYYYEADEEPDWSKYPAVDSHSFVGTTSDGRKKYRYHISGLDFDRIEALEEYMEDLQDEGHLTPIDKMNIKAWKDAIRKIKHDANKRAKGSRSLTSDEQTAVNNYQQLIDETRESKRGGLNTGETQEIKDIREFLVDDEVDVKFKMSAESMFNKDVAISFIPQRRGFLVLHYSMGDDYFVYEDKSITATRETSVDPIISATNFQVSGNGGAFWFRVPYVEVQKNSTVVGGAVYAGHTGSDTTPRVASISYDAWCPTGTNAYATANSLPNDTYNWSLNLVSDGNYMPILYGVHLELQPVGRDVSVEKTVVSSTTHPYISWEVGTRYDEDNRGRGGTITFTVDSQNYHNLTVGNIASGVVDLAKLGHYQIVLSNASGPWFTGVLMQPSIEVFPSHVVIKYEMYDRWSIVRSARIYSGLIGDNKQVAYYVSQIVTGVGLNSDEIIISGRPSTNTITPAVPGEEPCMKPDYATIVADHLERISSAYCTLMEMWFDGAGRFHLEPIGTVTKNINYHTTSGNDRYVMMDVSIDVDYDSFRNDLTVVGAEYRGSRISARYQDYSSVFIPTSENFVGRWIAGDVQSDDALRTQALVNLALLTRRYKEGRPRKHIGFKTFLDEDMAVGDRVRCDGVPVEIVEISHDNIIEGTMKVKVRVL